MSVNVTIVVFASGNLVNPKGKTEDASWLKRSSQPVCSLTAPGPVHFLCLSSFVPSHCSVSPSWLCLLPSWPPPGLLSVCFSPIWRPHWVPRATQPPGNSNRWGGTASLTDGPTEAELLQQSSLGNRRQELSHHGCLLNRNGRGQRKGEEARVYSPPKAAWAIDEPQG